MRLDILPVDAPQDAGRLQFGATLEWQAGDAAAPPALAAKLAATLELTTAGLRWLLAHPTAIDLRNPELGAACAGRLALRGAPLVAELWLQLLKRPTPADAAALALACAQAPVRPRAGDLEGGAEDADGANLERAVLQAIARRSPRRLRRAVALDRVDCRGLRAAVPAGGYSGGALAPAALVRAIDWPALPPQAFSGAQVWAGDGGPGVLTRLHCDAQTSLLAHLEGRKQVLLVSPRLRDMLYVVEAYNSFQPCRVDARRPDLARHPRFAQAEVAQLELAPGDLLVIPTGWFHCVWADEPVVSVSRFVRDALVAAALPAALAG